MNEPNLYHIVLEDNENVPLNFARDLIHGVFKKSETSCEENLITMKKYGQVVVDILPLQFAEQKQVEVSKVAKLEGHKIHCRIAKVRED